MRDILVPIAGAAGDLFAWALALSLLWAPVSADTITITRTGACDWTCNSEGFEQLSCHTRVDKAIEACANRSLADGREYVVIPAQYRVKATLDETPPPPPPPSKGKVELNWTPPTTNEDGSPLQDLSAFYIYAGCERSGDYELPKTIVTAPAASASIENLPFGKTCYFAATAVNSSDTESRLSNEAVKLVSTPE